MSCHCGSPGSSLLLNTSLLIEDTFVQQFEVVFSVDMASGPDMQTCGFQIPESSISEVLRCQPMNLSEEQSVMP